MQLVYIDSNDDFLPDLDEIPEEDLVFPIQEVPETQDILNPYSHQEEIGNQQQPSETKGNVQDVNPPLQCSLTYTPTQDLSLNLRGL